VWATFDAEIVLTPKVLLLYQRAPNRFQASAYRRESANYELHALSASFWGRDWYAAVLDGQGSPLTKGDREAARDALEAAQWELPAGLAPAASWLGKQEQPVLVESVQIANPYAGPAATGDTIGRCLTVWPLGTTRISDDANPFSFAYVVNTPTNWCIFENWDTPDGLSLYCRCARIATCNHRMVFIQNVKMSVADHKSLNQCFMSEDNLAATRALLEVDATKFDPPRCAFMGPEGREWGTIYWSVNEMTADRITLRGCEGKTYVHNRPMGRPEEKLEYFAPPRNGRSDD